MNWPTTNALPAMPNVTVRFGGLVGFCYRRTGECEVGFNTGDGRHQIQVLVFENEQEIYRNESFPNGSTIRFGVEGKDPGVNFLKLSPDPFNRQTGAPKDFRWMLDLEGPDFYSDKPPKDSGFRFKAKLSVNQGTVYTYETTKSTFDRVSVWAGIGGTNARHLYNVAREMAAAIRVTDTEVAFLEINGQTVSRLPGTAGKEYEVLFGNTCKETSGNICEWTPGSIVESWRNDFRFHRDIFSLPFDRARYGLRLDRPGPPEPHNPPKDLKAPAYWKPFGTDRAPCMGVGYGETDGFPT